MARGAVIGGGSPLLAAARRLRARARGADPRLPPLLFFTDPARTPDPEAVARRLPRGAAIVFRAFGAPDAVERGLRLKAIAKARGLILLVGADAVLARAIGADGVHLPQRLAFRAGALRRRNPRWIVTAAAHGPRAILAAKRAGVHAVVVSPVFASPSPSAGKPLGIVRFAALARSAGVAVYALGGVNEKTAPRLLGSGAVGLAAVKALT